MRHTEGTEGRPRMLIIGIPESRGRKLGKSDTILVENFTKLIKDKNHSSKKLYKPTVNFKNDTLGYIIVKVLVIEAKGIL